MSMLSYHSNNPSADIPWVNPSLDYFEDKSVTQQSLGSQSSSSEYSTFCDDFPMAQHSSFETRPPSDYLPLSDWGFTEQPVSDDFFGVDSCLGDPLDAVPLDNSLTAINVPQTAPDTSPVYIELQDPMESARQQTELLPSIPSPLPMSYATSLFQEQYWKGDNFPEFEISAGEEELADVSSLESNASLPTITTMFSTASISNSNESSICKTECSNGSTFPTQYVQKQSKNRSSLVLYKILNFA